MNWTRHLNKIPLLNWVVSFILHAAHYPLSARTPQENAICQNKAKFSLCPSAEGPP
jgi:hypothetical protein